MSEEKGSFKKLKSTKLTDLFNEMELPESDLTIQTDDAIHQFEYIDEEEKRKLYTIKPGCFTIEDTSLGTQLVKFQLREYTLLKSIVNTKSILDESGKFFTKLDIYKTLGRDPKRAILLCSPPGVGKTAAINEVCRTLLGEEEGTCVVTWDTSGVRARSVNSFFLNGSQFSKKVKRLIFVIEDISGGTTEDDYGAKGVNTSLLNLLDGVGSPFKGVPTFIIATTNNPEREVGALIDRPGRFDKVVELKTPDGDESVELLKFISKKDELSEDDIEAAKLASKNEFSIAHLQEMVVRSLLDDITILEACEQLVTHKKRFKKAFQEEKTMGIGIR
jgi:SpoVK/Ycf46/Vps4 family AAA+-type ATPase